MVVFSTLPEVGWVSAKNVNKLTQSGKVSLVTPCTLLYLGRKRLRKVRERGRSLWPQTTRRTSEQEILGQGLHLCNICVGRGQVNAMDSVRKHIKEMYASAAPYDERVH